MSFTITRDVSVGYDSDDQVGYDIRSTVLSVLVGPHGRYLRVEVSTYDASFYVDSWLRIDARLDARGDWRPDANLHMWITDMSGSGCLLKTGLKGHRLVDGHFSYTPQLRLVQGSPAPFAPDEEDPLAGHHHLCQWVARV